jgi:hypothetical protein
VTDPDDVRDHPNEGPRAPRSPAVLLLVILVAVEAVGMAALTALLIVDLLTSTPTSVPSAVALIALAALAAVFLGGIARGILQGRSWVRPAAVTWQVLQIAVGVGSLQGAEARSDIGWALIVPAAVVLVLLFTRSVMLATRRVE